MITKSLYKIAVIFYVLSLSSCTRNETDTEWEKLFNGKDLSNWEHYLAIPDSSSDIPDFPRDVDGNYIEPLGYMSSDPLNVFSVVDLDGEKVIKISGEVIGNLFTKRSFENYHLKLKFKWGNIKWEWMKGRPKDGGILYHYNSLGPGLSYRHEFQIHEGDVGSYWAKNTCVEIPARYTTELPESIVEATAQLKEIVPTLKDTMLIFDENSKLFQFEGKDEWQICLANPLNENPEGEWNTLELICYENHAIHIVNEKVNMIILSSYIKYDDKNIPIDRGLIQLQSEGAEIFFKDLYIKNITQIPEQLHRYL